MMSQTRVINLEIHSKMFLKRTTQESNKHLKLFWYRKNLRNITLYCKKEKRNTELSVDKIFAESWFEKLKSLRGNFFKQNMRSKEK